MRHAEDKTTIITLPTGLRVAHRANPRAAVEYCGAIINAGSRDDAKYHYGMAHFVEHTIFKGTHKRSSWHIINRMERIGGELNAYTTKEETVVYTGAPSGNADRAFELIADLVTNSRFPDQELDKEREVVSDEINSYLDTPADAVYDDFEDQIFAGTPLGHNILGDTPSISQIDSEACRAYLHKWFTAPNIVLFYYGPASAERIDTLARRHFCGLPTHTVQRDPMPANYQAPHFSEVKDINSHQAHTVMGAVTAGMYDENRYATALLTNILGGPGMNSLLNINLREKRGLVYSVEATTSLLSDCGLFTIYFGCDPADTSRCETLVRQQLDTLSATPLSERTLNAAKKQYLGQLAVASDNRESVAISTGRSVLYYNEIMSTAHTIERINAITPAQLQECTQTFTRLSTLTLR